MMKTYEVSEVRFRTRHVRVEASSPESAVKKVERGEGQVVGYTTDPVHHYGIPWEIKDGQKRP